MQVQPSLEQMDGRTDALLPLYAPTVLLFHETATRGENAHPASLARLPTQQLVRLCIFC